MNNRDLAIHLSRCESEQKVIDILTEAGLWDQPRFWCPFGDIENNWSTIGNQQSEAEAALVEKIVNSIDAMLMKECLVRGISPESAQAPKSIAEAMETYFHIKGGKLQDITPSERTQLAKSITLAATGSKPGEAGGSPCITIVDSGEGQTPLQMPNTILSLNKSNKLKVPFVQGKFNMGGTGVLRFCGTRSFQLIISKRCPNIRNVDGDPSFSDWGFTIVRRERPRDGQDRRSSMITYLVGDDRKIRTFSADEGINIIPTSKGQYETMHFGMYCKMYEFHMTSRLCSNINMNLYNRLSTLLPNLAYPVYLDECRDYRAHTMFRTLSGLNVRLSDQSTNSEFNNIEQKLSVAADIDGQQVSVSVYVFRKTTDKGKEVDKTQFRADEGILLTQNGQTHGSFDRKFYKRSAVGLSYLADSILTIVDCSKIDETTREDLFMNSRDRMSASGFERKLESWLEDFLKGNDTLRQIQAKRREDALANKLNDEKPLEDILSSVFKSSSVLSKLFILGERLQNPMNLGSAPASESFEGKYNPTFFTIVKKSSDSKLRRDAQIGRKFRIKFKTDAENEFFSREEYPGAYQLYQNGELCGNHSLSLHNGTAVLSVQMPEEAESGKAYVYKCIVTDTNTEQVFENEFEIVVVPYHDGSGGEGGRTPPPGDDSGKKTLAPMGISLPNVAEVTKEEWETYEFTKDSALVVRRTEAESDVFDFYVNMDNIHLQTEVKPLAKDEAKVKLFKARYKYSMVLVGLSVLGYYKNNPDEEGADAPEEKVKAFSQMISPIILPIIDVMGSDMRDILAED